MDDDNVARRREVSTLLRVALRTGAEVVTCANDFLQGEDPPPDEVADDAEEGQDDEYEEDTRSEDASEHVGGVERGADASSGHYVPLGAAAAVGIFRNAFGGGGVTSTPRASINRSTVS